MTHKIGIRHEDKYLMERRVPIIPFHVKKLVKEQGLEFQVQASAKRIFKEEEFEAAGAEIVNDLDECNVVFGVKEMPIDFFKDGRTYIYEATAKLNPTVYIREDDESKPKLKSKKVTKGGLKYKKRFKLKRRKTGGTKSKLGERKKKDTVTIYF